jgi:hypothetical protein
MLNNTRARQKRRPVILEGISQGFNHSEIATQLGVNKWVILNDLRLMRKNGDPVLKEAQKTQEEIIVNKPSIASISNKKFLNMTGMTLQEKSFRNMIHFHRHELIEILKSKDQSAAISNLSKNTRKTLKYNEILENWGNKYEITKLALKHLHQYQI